MRMNELWYSILRYTPSFVSGESINLAALFYYPDTDYREFFSLTKWSRLSSFDDSLNIPLIKNLMLDIADEIGTPLTAPNFNIQKFCAQYQSQIYFDQCVAFPDVFPGNVSEKIEEIKQIYFQFEYDMDSRPTREDQKRFLGKLLRAQKIDYHREAVQKGAFDENVTYDYLFCGYGVKFFDLNAEKISGQTLNKAKAWAWNCKTDPNGLKIVILYDLADPNRADAKPIVSILEAAAYKTINIHQGYGEALISLNLTKALG